MRVARTDVTGEGHICMWQSRKLACGRAVAAVSLVVVPSVWGQTYTDATTRPANELQIVTSLNTTQPSTTQSTTGPSTTQASTAPTTTQASTAPTTTQAS